MPTEEFDLDRQLAFIQETETAVALLDEGIRSIAAWDGGLDRRIIALHLMAQGFERFLKLTIVLVQLCTEGTLPSSKRLRNRYSHTLPKLLDDILAACIKDSTFTAGSAIKSDIDFLATDERWREMLEVLSDFGSGGRYHDLDTMLDGSASSESPLDRLDALELKECRADPEAWHLLSGPDGGAFARHWYPALATRQSETLQQAARAVARMWTLGPAREHGKLMTGVIGRFLFLTDDQLGTPTR